MAKPNRPLTITEIGEKIRLHRANQNLSLREFSSMAGVEHTTLMRLEKGKDVRLSLYLKLANAHGIRLL